MTRPKQTLDARLEEIINEYRVAARAFGTLNASVARAAVDDEAIAQIKAEIRRVVDEVIQPDGETVLHGKVVKANEMVSFDFDTDDIPEIMLFIQENGKNVLRAEQRQRRDNIIGERE